MAAEPGLMDSGDRTGVASANRTSAGLMPASEAKRREPSAMTVPGRPALFAAIVLALILPGVLIEPRLAYAALAGDLVLIALVIWDGVRLSEMPVNVQREESRRLQLGRSAEFVYRIENRGPRAAIVSLRQLWPDSFEPDQDRLEVLVQPGEVVRAAFATTPHRRSRERLAARRGRSALPSRARAKALDRRRRGTRLGLSRSEESCRNTTTCGGATR